MKEGEEWSSRKRGEIVDLMGLGNKRVKIQQNSKIRIIMSSGSQWNSLSGVKMV